MTAAGSHAGDRQDGDRYGMETKNEVWAHLDSLHEAVWELVAIALALRDPAATDPGLRRAAEHVLLEAGLMVASPQGVRPAQGLAELLAQDAGRVGSEVSTAILQSAAVLSGAKAWTGQDDEAILAQGRASARGAQPFSSFAFPQMEGLDELLSGPSPVMLDVGVGVAAMAIAYCDIFPTLRVVGLDVFARALELARCAVAEAGMEDRIELRNQDVAELEDREVFCLAWVPAPFLPRSAIDGGLPRVAASLVPGGWVMLGHGKLGRSGLSNALTRFETVAFGGTALDDAEAEDLLLGVGLELVTTLPNPAVAPALTVGRRPARPGRV